MATMYDHMCDPVGGYAGPLVKNRPVNSSALENAYAGRVVSLNDSGEFVMANGGSGNPMPLFLLKGIESPSAYDSQAGTDWVPVTTQLTVFPALVATGGFEVQTTEYETNQTYDPNTPLTATATGLLTPGAFYTDWIVGICSVGENAQNIDAPLGPSSIDSPLAVNAHRKTVLTFWTMFLPSSS